jgi:hypothetical protein
MDAVQGVTDFGEALALSKELQPGNFNIRSLERTELIERSDDRLRWIRLGFTEKNPDHQPWNLVIRDWHYRVLDVVGSSIDPGDRVWTGRLGWPKLKSELSGEEKDTTQIYLDFVATSDPTTKLVLDTAVVMLQEAKHPFYSRQDPKASPRWSDLWDASGIGDAVALTAMSQDRRSWSCTGFAVAQDRLITAWHCGAPPSVAEKNWPDVCASMVLDFSWDGDAISREYTCTREVDEWPDKDLVLLEIRPLHRLDILRSVVVASQTPHKGQPVRLVHHPLGLEKKISSRECFIENAPTWLGPGSGMFGHRCDSEGGSSGGHLLIRKRKRSSACIGPDFKKITLAVRKSTRQLTLKHWPPFSKKMASHHSELSISSHGSHLGWWSVELSPRIRGRDVSCA